LRLQGFQKEISKRNFKEIKPMGDGSPDIFDTKEEGGRNEEYVEKEEKEDPQEEQKEEEEKSSRSEEEGELEDDEADYNPKSPLRKEVGKDIKDPT